MKRNPMPPRKAPMDRGTGIVRRSPLTAVPRAQAAPRYTGPSRKVRALVLERDGHACVCCGTSIIGRPYSLGHRLRASQGGKPVPSNLITLLGMGGQLHHGRIDNREDPADEAKGYTVRSWGNPALIPVMLFSPHGSGVMAWLDDGGAYAFEAPEAAA